MELGDRRLDLGRFCVGSKLGAGAPHARMIVVQLDSEFMAAGNVKLMQSIEQLVSDVKQLHSDIEEDGVEIGISGPSAIGADMMRAAALGVQQTEWISILMVLAILAFIYRGPLLVLIPLCTILISLSVSMSIVSLLAEGPVNQSNTGFLTALPVAIKGGWIQVFTTTKIFLVVLLFGIGTDFCLFLISRCREGLIHKKDFSRKTIQRVVASSWNGVHDAIVGSGLTTSIGLLMMVFSDFEKFRYNGSLLALRFWLPSWFV